MPRDDEKSLSGQDTFNGEGRDEKDAAAESLGDEMTFAGGRGLGEPRSLGEEATFGDDVGTVDDVFDDGMEIVDLASRYTTEGTLGKGGMGEVLLATDTRLNRKVAIKRILGSAARSKTAVHRFLNEAQSIAALNHPNIVQIYDYGRAKDGPFLIMEFVEGSSLLDKCREGAVSLEEAIGLTCQLCDGLSKAHAANIVHRDIKPANVLLTQDGIPKLTDFGLAKDEVADTGMTMAGAVLGTLDFMPPEQRKDAALTDNRSDLWSLAATLYQMVTGKSPKVIKLNDVPKTVQNVLGKALEDSKDDRYQNALEFKEALQQSLQSGADAYAELDQGECPHCGTRNDASRKFCRNADCGGSLEVPCLTCKTSIPMWEAVCGSCGAKQEPLVAQRREEMAAQKVEAEAYVANHDYDQARRLLTKVEGVQDLRLQQLSGWVATFTDQLQAEEERAVENAGKRILEAQQHEEASDYSAAIKSVEQIPDGLRDRKLKNQSLAARTFLAQLQRNQQRVQSLEKQLRERVKTKQLTGLLKEVESLLRLVPNHANALKLKKQLLARDEKLKGLRDKLYSKAVRNFESQNYKETLADLAGIDSSQVDSEVEELRDQAETVVSTLVSLNKQIKERLAAKEYSELENLVDHFLILKAEDHEKKRLKEQLVERDGARKLAREERFAEAHEQVRQHEYSNALASLKKIPRELVDSEVRGLRDQIRDTLAQIDLLDGEIGQLRESGDTTALRTRLKEYLALQPDDGERQKLLAQLMEEEQKAQELADNAFSRARDHVDDFQFEAALTELAKIPEARSTDESRSLAESCSKLKTLREKALYELEKSFRFHIYGKAIEAAQLYAAGTPLLSTDKDSEFHDLRDRCLRSQKAHKEQSRRNEEKRALKKKAMITFAVGACIAMTLAGVLWTSKMRRASELASALNEQRWEDALKIEPDNLKALTGQATALLKLPQPEVTAALEILEQIETIQQDVSSLKPLKARALALQCQMVAEAGEAEKADGLLNEAVRLGVEDNLARKANNATAKAYFQRANELLNAKTESDYDETENVLTRVRVLSGDSREYKDLQKLAAARYLERANSLLDEGVLDSSWTLISRAQTHDAMNPAVKATKVRFLTLDAEAKAARGDHLGSLASYEAAVRLPQLNFASERARQYIEIGKLKVESGDAESAIEQLKKAIQLDDSLLEIATLAIPLTTLVVDQYENKGTDNSIQAAIGVMEATLPYHQSSPELAEEYENSYRRLNSSLLKPVLFLENNITEASLQAAARRLSQLESLGSVKGENQAEWQTRVVESLAKHLAKTEVTEDTTDRTELLVKVWNRLHGMMPDKMLIDKKGAELLDSYSARLETRLSEGDYRIASQLDHILRTIDTANKSNSTDKWLGVPASQWASKVSRKTVDHLLNDMRLKVEEQLAEKKYSQAAVVYEAIQQLDSTIKRSITDKWLAIPNLEVRGLSSATRERVKASVSKLAIESGDYQKALAWDPENSEASGMKKAADLAEALARGDYRTALNISPDNAAALSMQRAAAVQQALDERDYQRALRLEPTLARTAMLSMPPIRNSIGIDLKLIPGGTYVINEGGENAHEVILSKSFYLGVFEVTQEQYAKVMVDNPSYFKSPQHPVERVSWDDAIAFCRKLSSLPAEQAAGRVYHLPTEAQWEYACRAGTGTAFGFGDKETQVSQHAWYDGNSGNRTHPVGGKQANAWGLYDMHGNVWEWCRDWYGAYTLGRVTDPNGPLSGSSRVIRGGSWYDFAESCRSSAREAFSPSNRNSSHGGFRIMCVIPVQR